MCVSNVRRILCYAQGVWIRFMDRLTFRRSLMPRDDDEAALSICLMI